LRLTSLIFYVEHLVIAFRINTGQYEYEYTSTSTSTQFTGISKISTTCDDKVLELVKRNKIASQVNILPGISSSQEPDKLVEVVARNELGFVKQKDRFIVPSLPALNSISCSFCT
jgi:hypothetical protein